MDSGPQEEVKGTGKTQTGEMLPTSVPRMVPLREKTTTCFLIYFFFLEPKLWLVSPATVDRVTFCCFYIKYDKGGGLCPNWLFIFISSYSFLKKITLTI